MIPLDSSLLVVTDLDGSLLDHHDYNWDAASEWLARLKQHQIPLVICSSKTAAEIVPLQKKLGISGAPFIAENGACVSPGGDYPLADEPGEAYRALCQTLQALQADFRFEGFHQFSDADVARFTGLTLTEASQSRRRDASEVVLWRDEEARLDDFRAALAVHQLALTQGGRFWHVMPAGSGKGVALQQIQQHMAQHGGRRTTLGLGDGPNDAPMLEQVDYAVVIKGFSKTPVVLQRTDTAHVYYTTHTGPEGWREGLDYFLAQSA